VAGVAGVAGVAVAGAALTVLALAALGAGPAAAQAPGAAWLDGPPRAWNAPGAAVPPAPAGDRPAACLAQERIAGGAEDTQLAAAGWRLLAAWPVQRAGATAAVLATAGYDGMCRPTGLNGFVFAGGRFAGTLAPAPMAARADGVLTGPPALDPGGAALAAAFRRCAPADPACCPSRPETRVAYRLEGAPGAPVLVVAAAGGGPGAALPHTGGGPAPAPAGAAGWAAAAAAGLVIVAAASHLGSGRGGGAPAALRPRGPGETSTSREEAER
jgi:hypothetical protein